MLLKMKTMRRNHTDAEVVEGIWRHDKNMEEWFYASARSYFDRHFKEVFFDKDRKQEIFQTAFLKIWTEMTNGTISVSDGNVVRRRHTGEVHPMTCSLLTFVMAFAKMEYRELVRSERLDYYGEIFDNAEHSETMTMPCEESADTLKARIVDDCIQRLSPRCVEILTMFYYEGKSLDEILMLRSDRSSSKNGLKTAKNKCMNTLRSMATEEFRKCNI